MVETTRLLTIVTIKKMKCTTISSKITKQPNQSGKKTLSYKQHPVLQLKAKTLQNKDYCIHHFTSINCDRDKSHRKVN